MNSSGAKNWVFADGYLPKKNPSSGGLEAHEALMILNTGTRPAHVHLDFYFDNRDPVKGIPVEVGPERVICFRLDHPDEIGGVVIPPLTQYALRVRSDVKVVVQLGRLDTTQNNLAYYVNVGHFS
ncbi:MAG: sensory rhodopsin transducer [Chloroflexota bacterium]